MKHALRRMAVVALLAAAGAASAQSSSVRLYGLVDIGVGRFEDNNNDAGGSFFTRPWASRWRAEPGMMTSSYWGLAGKEPLVNGVHAEFKVEAFFRADNGAQGRFPFDTLFARDAYVGLSSQDLGSSFMGRNTTPLFISTLLFNPFGDSFSWSPSIRQYFNGSAGGQLRGDSGWNNSIKYSSADFGGLTFGAIASAGEGAPVGATTGTGKNWSLSGLYFAKSFALSAVYQSVEQTNMGGHSQDSWQLGASWDLRFAKFYGQFGQIDDSDLTGIRDDLWALGVEVPLGAGKLLGAWGETRYNGSGSGKRSTGSIGYSHALSKRTDITAAAMWEELSAGARAIDFADFKSPAAAIVSTAGNTGTSVGISLRHRF